MNLPHRKTSLALLLAVLSRPAAAAVRTGLDVLASEGFAPLRGKTVGLVTNHTGVARNGTPTAVLMRRAGIALKVIFTPEHGYTGRAEHGRAVVDSRDAATDVPIVSLYGATKRPTDESLAGLDVLVFDIQDVGTRFYTYITTLGYVIEAAAAKGIEVYVLDRPNPIRGDIVEGETLDPAIRHFTAYYSIPTRHGMTVGEIARWHDGENRLGAKLIVVRMEGWTRTQGWEDTGLRFRPPSPNIRTPRAALLYAGVGAFESTNVSVGRGTASPFELLGAPWLDGEALSRRLNGLALPGVRFRPVRFTPSKDLYAGRRCRGVRIVVTDRDAIRPVDVFVHAACLIRDAHPADFAPRWAEMPHVVGSREFETLFTGGAGAATILERLHASAETFRVRRAPYLLYP